jgi:type VI secretion system secreted protein Hcp
MATDVFARLGDIRGESTDDQHKDEIEVLSWSWGVTQSGSIAHGGGGRAGKASFHDLAFTHRLDRASPLLLRACATGEHIREATISQRKAGEDRQDFLVIKLSDVVITGVAPAYGGDASETIESVALQFGRVELAYRAQKPDGSVEPVEFKYDIRANREG